LELIPVSPTAKALAQNFTGDVYVNQVKTPHEPSRLIVGYVRFTPGARTNWHFHALGQTLHCTAASAWSPPATAPSSRCARRHHLDPTRRRTLARRHRRQPDVPLRHARRRRHQRRHPPGSNPSVRQRAVTASRGAGKKGQDVAGGALLAAGFRQRQVCPGLVAVAAPVLLVDFVAGLGRVGDGAVGAAFGDARLAAKSRTRTSRS
jgi:hypothetical protein